MAKVPTTRNITAINKVTSFQCFEKIGDGDIVFGLNNGYSNVHTTLDCRVFVRIRAQMLGAVSIVCKEVPRKVGG